MSDTDQSQSKKRKTLKNKESKPFWNEKAAQISQQWGLDLKTQPADKREGENIESNSWFSIVKHKQAPLVNDSLDLPPKVNSEKEILRARHVRLYPTASQQETLRKWFGTQRYLYNRALKMHRDGQPMNIKTLRLKLTNNDTNILEPHEQWPNEYHYTLKDEALRDLVNLNSTITRPTTKYRSALQIEVQDAKGTKGTNSEPFGSQEILK